MAKPFSTLKTKMSPKILKEVEDEIQKIIAEMPLQELRHAKSMSQEHLATILHTKQANISRLERRTDIYISTLRSYIEAMGGELQIIANFPEGNIKINQFQKI